MSTKSKMTSLIALLAATPVAIWLFKRWACSRPRDQQSLGNLPAAGLLTVLDSVVINASVCVPLPESVSSDEQDRPSELAGNEEESVHSGLLGVATTERADGVHFLLDEPDTLQPSCDPLPEPAPLLGEQESVSLDPLVQVHTESGQIEQPDVFQVTDQLEEMEAARELPGTDYPDSSFAGTELEANLHDQGVLYPSTTNPVPDARHDSELQLSDDEMQESVSGLTEKTINRYRPPTQRRPGKPSPAPSSSPPTRERTETALDIRLRMTFDRSGYCSFSLLPVRGREPDTEVAVRYWGGPLQMFAQDDWYQDLHFDDIGALMRDGVEFSGKSADHRRLRWLLTGRDVYVLAAHQKASGLVSDSRLVMGRSHTVLCTAAITDEVDAILREGGCQNYSRLGESEGIPAGWVGLRNVTPQTSIPLTPGADPYYAIKAAPDLEIGLEGGICIRNSVWLAGYPPQIKLFGKVDGTVTVLIDGELTKNAADQSLMVTGYDLPGEHSVICEGLSISRSYSIEEPSGLWKEWSAYRFDDTSICGPLVQRPSESPAQQIITVPMSNPVLIGAEPGQMFRCSSRSGSHWKGFVPFEVVWALPANSLTCDKKSARILQLADARVVRELPKLQPVSWSNAILDASRKGLRIETNFPNGLESWKSYKKVARSIRKGRR